MATVKKLEKYITTAEAGDMLGMTREHNRHSQPATRVTSKHLHAQRKGYTMSSQFDGFGKHLKQRMDSANPNNARRAVGISWFRPETYDACMSIFSDANDLPGSYRDWLILAEQTEKDVINQGITVVRVEIDPETFPKWCAANGHSNIDRRARGMFGNAMALEWLQKNS